MKIGVFDSGVGGQSVVNAIIKEVPNIEVVYREDKEHVPYGNRDIEEIYKFVAPILQSMVVEGCRVIVIACNTVTTNLIERLRQSITVPLVGMEPMVKPAAIASKSKTIAVFATPRTLESSRYLWLKRQFAKDIKVLEPDCSEWAYMIQGGKINRDKIADTVDEVIKNGADQIVLGCTHYHWIEALIKQLATGRAEVLQPEIPVIKQLKKVLAQLS